MQVDDRGVVDIDIQLEHVSSRRRNSDRDKQSQKETNNE